MPIHDKGAIITVALTKTTTSIDWVVTKQITAPSMVAWAAIITDDRILQTKLETSIIMNESSLQKAIGEYEPQVNLAISIKNRFLMAALTAMTMRFHE